jgi:glycosyltransferase involved in cell wall biosynthesis
LSTFQHSPGKILILSSWYPSKVAPYLGNFVQQQARLLSAIYDVTVLYFSIDNRLSAQEIDESRNERLREIIIYYPKRGNLLMKKRELDKAFYTGIAMVDKPDLIHGHCILPKGYLFSKAKAHFKCPLIVTEHGSYFRQERLQKWRFNERFIASSVKDSIDCLIAVSEFQRKDLQTYFKSREIYVVPNPVDTSLFKPKSVPNDLPIRFLHVSTLDPAVKNPKGIIEAVDLLCEKGYKHFHLTIVSDEPYEELQIEVRRLKLDAFVSFVGPLPHETLVGYYNNCHAFVMFSNYETFSIVIAEAWSCGRPVISTPVGVAASMNEYLGLVVQDTNPLSLALEMEKIINGKEFKCQVIREYALQFDSQVVLDQLVKVYEEFL